MISFKTRSVRRMGKAYSL